VVRRSLWRVALSLDRITRAAWLTAVAAVARARPQQELRWLTHVKPRVKVGRTTDRYGGSVARRVFHSFHFERDSHRVSQVKNMGVVEGQPLLSSNQWEDVKKGGDTAIQKWIDEQMSGKSCVVVLIGNQTAGRKWVNYEFTKAWGDRKGVVGVYIHNLKNLSGYQDTKGGNPFSGFTLCEGKKSLSNVVKAYDPPYSASTSVYDYIKNNLEDWVEEAIKIRNEFTC
jgi:hypothetical protein